MEADEDNDEIQEGERMGIVRLDDGRRIQVPMRYLEAREGDDSPGYEDVEMDAKQANENGGNDGNAGQEEVPDQPMNLVEGSQDRVERLDSAASSESDPEFRVTRTEPWGPDPVQLTALEFEFYNRM